MLINADIPTKIAAKLSFDDGLKISDHKTATEITVISEIRPKTTDRKSARKSEAIRASIVTTTIETLVFLAILLSYSLLFFFSCSPRLTINPYLPSWDAIANKDESRVDMKAVKSPTTRIGRNHTGAEVARMS